MSSGLLSSRYRTAFVTGASTGLGRAFTEMLLAAGLEVWGTARDRSRVPDRPRFRGVTLELSNGKLAEAIFLESEKEAGGFDIVINNAGFGAFGDYAHTDFSIWEEQYRVMLINAARISHLALRGMLARNRGALVNVSSIAAEFGMPYQAVYNSIKAGLSALNTSLMYEVKGTGICIIDFRPGDYRTDFEGSVRRPPQSSARSAATSLRMSRVWNSFAHMMQTGPAPAGAAADLHTALLRGRSGTVRTGRFFQAVLAPFLARFGSLSIQRRIQEKYFGL